MTEPELVGGGPGSEGDFVGDFGESLEGEIDVSSAEREASVQDTLDEPVTTTIGRDLKNIMTKFAYVLIPHQNRKLLRDWDLWGPLLLTVTLAMFLRDSAPDSQKNEVFTGVFFIMSCVLLSAGMIWTLVPWSGHRLNLSPHTSSFRAGSCIITFNNQLLGGSLSFFQGVTVLGYCTLPLVIACVCMRFISYLVAHIAVRLVVVGAGLGWAVWASYGFLAGSGPAQRKALIVYPTVLFYTVIAWLILNDSKASSPTGVSTTATVTTTMLTTENQSASL